MSAPLGDDPNVLPCLFLFSQNTARVLLQPEGDLLIEWDNDPDVNDWVEFYQVHVPLRVKKKFGDRQIRNGK